MTTVDLPTEISRIQAIRAEQVEFYQKHPCAESELDLADIDRYLNWLTDLVSQPDSKPNASLTPATFIRRKDFYNDRLFDSEGYLMANTAAQQAFFESHYVPYAWIGPVPAQHKYLRMLASTEVHDLTELQQFKDLNLVDLYLGFSPVSNISLLPQLFPALTTLDLSHCGVTDLSPLSSLALTELYLFNTPVSDLRPLTGLKLTILDLRSTLVTDLTALRAMPLIELDLSDTAVSDITALQGMPLKKLNLTDTAVTDISALKGMLEVEVLVGTVYC